ncbi:aspartyl-tRNA(Asn)/glutamyl-tRNA(Gln) amidotransferase subunit A [Azospirillum lipoferum]|uniref:Amidase n=1 Tax=Azospirillum lipoferum TaxID=193 RepID=A0A5A9GIS7_AZOLI|nr:MULTISPECIES: amidase [Azospirillum]KAA0594361.1 amidase [Azospirillum lipoferum]MCP1613095.1 aspartyl-tRNA(Asn)/glutamyl-tRNA(Gln) amidotransferase subunit A [Azospirillum lipoferum]MDW5531295.1 amidase [Azospirillum sp. NL1]
MTRFPRATAVAEAVRAGHSSARAETEAALVRIADGNPALNAFVTVDAERALSEAEAIDRRLAAGERPLLAGVPVAVKDTIWVAGRRVTQGSRLFGSFRAPADAIAVERLRAAGAVILGMANSSEFACKGVTTNPLFGPTRHPQHPNLTPGGSSGGPAVAVAGGLVPLALGTDAGGSSRRPPAHVGAVGFKPSFGAIPYGPGFAEPFTGIAVMAPIAADVADAALMFEALCGPDPRDPDSIAVAPMESRPPESLSVAYSPRFGLDTPIDEDVRQAVESAVEALERAGTHVVRRDLSWPAGVTETALMPLQHAGLAALYGDAFRRDPALFDPDIAVQIERGLTLTGAEVAAAQLLGVEVARSLAAFFTGADLLIGPTTPCVAWPLDRLGPDTIGGQVVPPRAHAVFTPLFNHAKVPALSLPCGTGRNGLPVGLQVIAPRGLDRRVLRFAAYSETVLAAGGQGHPG